LSAATTARCGCGTWNLATGDEQAVLTGHDGPVMSVVVTADGATAVSGSDDSRVRVWDLATLDRTRLLDRGLHRRLLRRYTGQALKIAVGQQFGRPCLLELRGQQNAS